MGAPCQSICSPWAEAEDICNPPDASPETIEDQLLNASNILFHFTGRLWPGSCAETVRPCGGGSKDWCGCSGGRTCGCRRLSEIRLGGSPITSITEVKIDGEVVDPSLYRVDDWAYLVYLPAEDGDREGWPCFPAGTLVLTDVGLKPIESIEAGERVLTHRNRWRKVLRAGKTGTSETVRVVGRGGSIRCTPDHRFWAAEVYTASQDPERSQKKEARVTGRRKLGSPEWLAADQLVGHAWATPRRVAPLPVPIPAGWSSSPSFWWMVGRWVGDGWLRKNSSGGGYSVYICSGYHEADELAAILGPRWKRTGERTTARFRLADAALHGWLTSQFGTGSMGKRLPAWLLAAPEATRRSFLDGYVSADGYHAHHSSGRGRSSISIHTVNRELALGCRLLAATLGFAPLMYEGRQTTTHIEGRRVQGQTTTYRVDWPDAKPGEAFSQAHVDDDHLWGRVRAVELDERVVPVYDLEVEDDHSFVADGFVVHNCCQDARLPDTEDNTFSVAYTYGTGPDVGGKLAAATLAGDLAKACIGDTTCQLPKRVTTVVRQGVTLAVIDPLSLFEDGKTGIPDVDLWLASLRVGRRRRRATVMVPGQGRRIRRVGT